LIVFKDMMKKAGITHYQGHVSPVFDVARNLLTVTIRDGQEQGREDIVLDTTDPFLRAQELRDLGVDMIVCGAISQPYERALSAKDIKVIAFVCGALDEVLPALLKGQLEDGKFLMPGSSGPERYRRRCGREQR
jgi:predicted Fe-Mo cluster-binding NifX family protein